MVSAILGAALHSPWWIALVLVVMLAVAAATSAHRLGGTLRTLAMTAITITTGVAITLLVVLATGALKLSARYALAIGGIVVGGSMNVCTLAGGHFATTVNVCWDEVPPSRT